MHAKETYPELTQAIMKLPDFYALREFYPAISKFWIYPVKLSKAVRLRNDDLIFI